MDGSIVFTGGANVHQFNTCFLGPTGVSIPNGILIGTAFFAQLMAEGPYFTVGCQFYPSKLPFCMGIWTPALGPPKYTSQTTSNQSVQPFLQSSQLWQTD